MLSNRTSRVDPMTQASPLPSKKRSLNIVTPSAGEIDALDFDRLGTNTMHYKDKTVITHLESADVTTVLGEIAQGLEISTDEVALPTLDNDSGFWEYGAHGVFFSQSIEALSFNVLTPIFSPSNIVKTKNYSYHEAASKNITNPVGAIAGDIEVEVLFTAKKDVVIPMVPIYCDIKQVTTRLTKWNDATRDAAVGFSTPHYSWTQPWLNWYNDDRLELQKTQTVTEQLAFPPTLFTIRNSSGLETSGVVSTTQSTNSNSADVGLTTGVWHRQPCHFSTSVFHGISDGELLYKSWMFRRFKAFVPDGGHGSGGHVFGVKIVYSVFPLTAYVASNQTEGASVNFGSRCYGHQAVVLLPKKVYYFHGDSSGIGEWQEGKLEENGYLLTEYLPYMANDYDYPAHLEPHEENTVPKLLYGTSAEEQLYCAKIMKSGKSNITFGIKGAGAENITFPMNLSKLYDEDQATISNTILEIRRVSTSSNVSFIIKITAGMSIKEYALGCEYALVLVTYSKAADIHHSYAFCGDLDQGVVSMTILEKNGSRNASYADSFERIIGNDLDTSFEEPDHPYFSSYPSNATKTFVNVVPLYSANMLAKGYSGDEVAVSESMAEPATIWCGNPIGKFEPYFSIDGHGEGKLSGMSHALNQVRFPIIFPTPTLYSSSDNCMCIEKDCSVVSFRYLWSVRISGDDAIAPDPDHSRITINTNRLVIAPTSVEDGHWEPSINAETVYAKGYAWWINLPRGHHNYHIALHGYKPLGLYATFENKIAQNTNIYSLNHGTHTILPLCGTIVLYQTPVIGEGGVPTEANFTSQVYGVDFSTFGMVTGAKNINYAGRSMVHTNNEVLFSSSRYSLMSDRGSKYKEIENNNISDVYGISNFLVCYYPSSVVVYANYDNAIHRVATIVGKGVPKPIQEGQAVYIGVIEGSNAVVYELSREGGVIPILKAEGSSMALYIDSMIGTIAAIINDGSASIYQLRYGSIVKRAEIDADRFMYNESDTVSNLLLVDGDVAKKMELSVNTNEFTALSSDFVFPYSETARFVLYGIKLIFTPEIDSGARLSLTVTVNGTDVIDQDEVTPTLETVITFSSQVVGTASYKIEDCSATLRGVKWLVYQLPLLNESIGD